ncbi:MAG: S1 RNA-binding domain-containing protein [Gloeobacterales cyanobacterium]
MNYSSTENEPLVTFTAELESTPALPEDSSGDLAEAHAAELSVVAAEGTDVPSEAKAPVESESAEFPQETDGAIVEAEGIPEEAPKPENTVVAVDSEVGEDVVAVMESAPTDAHSETGEANVPEAKTEAPKAKARKSKLPPINPEEGAIVDGVVRKLVDFGAFVDIGAEMDGLMHISEMSWDRVAKPQDVLKVGQKIKTKIIKLEGGDKKRIGLSLKQATENPWSLVGTEFQVGGRYKGKVTRITDFGAFVELVTGLEGLLHSSEFSWAQRNANPKDFVKEGDEIEVVLISADPNKRRMALSRKQLQADPWASSEERYTPGQTVEVTVQEVVDFGTFCEVEEGMVALLPNPELTNHKEPLKAGEKLSVKVLDVDAKRRRMRLSQRALVPSSSSGAPSTETREMHRGPSRSKKPPAPSRSGSAASGKSRGPKSTTSVSSTSTGLEGLSVLGQALKQAGFDVSE